MTEPGQRDEGRSPETDPGVPRQTAERLASALDEEGLPGEAEVPKPRPTANRIFGLDLGIWENAVQAAGAGFGTLLGGLQGYFFSGGRPMPAVAAAFAGLVLGVFLAGICYRIYRFFRPEEPVE